MSAIINVSLDLKKIPTNKVKKGEKGNYVNVTFSINDDVKVWENGEYRNLQNVSAFISQSQEERQNKEAKNYVGGGSVVWISEEGIKTAKQLDEEQTTEGDYVEDENFTDDIPF